MEVEVIDNAEKSAKQQPNSRYENAMSKGWEWTRGVDVYHVRTGAILVAKRASLA